MGVDVVDANQKALGNRDFKAARVLLADDLHFAGPFETFESTDTI